MSEVRRVRPTFSDLDRANPHRGICTFQAFNGDPLFEPTDRVDRPRRLERNMGWRVSDKYLPSTVAYFRWVWADLAPARGKFDFSSIDSVLEMAAEYGQTVGIRIFPYGDIASQVPDWYARSCPVDRTGPDAPIRPNHDAPDYLEHFGGLIKALGERYDSHPSLETVDITFAGPWGCGEMVDCSNEQATRFIEIYRAAFPTTMRLSPAIDHRLKVAVAGGAGWHADGFGDLRALGSSTVSQSVSWNHMYDAYPRIICEAGAQEQWKVAPVFIESFYAPRYWHESGFDIDFILQQALKFHPTYFNPKYMALPDRWMDKIEAFSRRLGYNFAYRQAMYETKAKLGGKIQFRSWIENVGVAPMYYPYDFAVRLRQGDREEILVLDGVDPRKWLPGDVWIDRAIPVPSDFKPGMVDISAGIIDGESMQAKVSFSIKENYSDRWASLGHLEVTE